jgi:ABC-type antimicrobial peptide transport system permease subunit
MALGAEPGAVYRMIMRESGCLVAVGIGFGVGGAVAAGALARKLLFGVSAWDAQTLVSVVVLLAVAALVASFAPARRAASVNPVDALRSE